MCTYRVANHVKAPLFHGSYICMTENHEFSQSPDSELEYTAIDFNGIVKVNTDCKTNKLYHIKQWVMLYHRKMVKICDDTENELNCRKMVDIQWNV